jgi:cation:H+ antiporter
LFEAERLPIWLNLVILAATAVSVWLAGARLTRYVDGIANRTGLGHAFAGMVLLGGITSLAEIATVTSSSAIGNAPLAVNTLLGSSSINVMLLAIADGVYGRGALTSTVARPATLLQGTLGMMALGIVAAGLAAGEQPLGPVGVWSTALALGCLGALWLASQYDARRTWTPADDRGSAAQETSDDNVNLSLSSLVARTVAASAVICGAGFFLSQSADALAQQTGIGSGLIGLLLVGSVTSLPEISSITEAVRLKRYELVLGNIFGTNLFNLTLIFLADAVYPGEPVLKAAGAFEAVAALLALLLTGVFVLGLLERRDKTILRLGYDSAAALVLFAIGLWVLVPLSR